ncbi:MAG: S-methyl-5'-thioinosine phosphorylase [Gammaproteobacteria bacterium]|uniref:Probable S-methyl-5'-thioinosine phosphorylase n=1 Tax=Candidatus Thiopontia autotrophica TaxID=2841688 RepID=A0A8J6TSH4_9GAMM|nr:S-methyl-5'-thioinosine phosphorylase [Candidatus Thiopontia autotrophica]MBL6969438.1 S-methyl-5'-thioinosine phosphorylase [Gammaproteobacteria bacterium]
MDGLENVERIMVDTPYGQPSSDLIKAKLKGVELLFLSRHGEDHSIPPHKVNYRANIWALNKLEVGSIVAVAAIGGITEAMLPGRVSIPDQIIDYTWGREHTFFDGPEVEHIDFSWPYCSELRNSLLDAAGSAGVDVVDGGTYGATQGPRLESAAEIERMERDGCDIVGMTGMPEASLARELGICYACCAVSANWAAGKSDREITMEEIGENLKSGMDSVKAVIYSLIDSQT